MAGDINYYEVFDMTEGEVPAEPASDCAPDYGEGKGSRESPAAESTDSAADSAGTAARVKEKGETGTTAGPGKRGGRVQSAEENAWFAARRREREQREAFRGQNAAKPPAPAETGDQSPATTAFRPAVLDRGTAGEQGVPWEVSKPEGETFSLEEKTAPAALPESGDAAAREQLLQLRRAEAAMRAERDYAVDRSIRQRIESEASEIGRLDPAVRSWEDIRNSPDYGRLGELVRGGITLVDAYKLVHFDRLTQNAAAGARQAALNARNGKAHLQRLSGTGGETPGAVPGEALRAYRAIMPELSVREIEQHYNQYLKG